MSSSMKAYQNPNHPGNKLRPSVRCLGCKKTGCITYWGNWCFECNVKRLDSIDSKFEPVRKALGIAEPNMTTMPCGRILTPHLETYLATEQPWLRADPYNSRASWLNVMCRETSLSDLGFCIMCGAQAEGKHARDNPRLSGGR